MELAQLDWHASPAGLPVFKRVAEALAKCIRQGELNRDDALPSSRDLARLLKLHRNTILAAYDELLAQGYIRTEPGRGTFVSAQLTLQLEKQSVGEAVPLMPLKLSRPPRPYRPIHLGFKGIPLLGGLADIRLVPAQLLARAYAAALRNSKGSTLDYLAVRGHPRFLDAFAKYLSDTRGVGLARDEMLVTRGSQQALYLAARALAAKNSVIAVEAAGYPPAWEAFRLAGAKLLPVPIDAEGLIVSELAKRCKKQRIAAVYVTPHHQYPTTCTLSAARRLALLELAAREQLVIIEDDYDHEFHFDAKPVLPLKTLDTRGLVLHIGTLSKVLAPGLRIGYAIGQPALIELMTQHRAYLDRQGDHTLELALAYLIEDGELLAHVRRMLRCYRARRACLFETLDHYLGPNFVYSRPMGGIAVWGAVHSAHTATQLVERAAASGVLVQAAKPFYFDQRERAFLRLGYARVAEEEIVKAIKILGQIVHSPR